MERTEKELAYQCGYNDGFKAARDQLDLVAPEVVAMRDELKKMLSYLDSDPPGRVALRLRKILAAYENAVETK